MEVSSYSDDDDDVWMDEKSSKSPHIESLKQKKKKFSVYAFRPTFRKKSGSKSDSKGRKKSDPSSKKTNSLTRKKTEKSEKSDSLGRRKSSGSKSPKSNKKRRSLTPPSSYKKRGSLTPKMTRITKSLPREIGSREFRQLSFEPPASPKEKETEKGNVTI